jgi:tetratricopeptide (TPR) repeat protein
MSPGKLKPPSHTPDLHTPQVYLWFRLASLNFQRTGPVAELLNDGRVLVQGGTYTDYYAGNLEVNPPPEVWDPKTNVWSIAEELARTTGIKESRPDYTQKAKYGREYAALSTLEDGKILMTGGYTEGGCCGPFEIHGESDRTAVIIDPSSGSQTPAGTLCVARHCHAALRFPSGAIMLIGGAHDDNGAIDDVELGLPAGVKIEEITTISASGSERKILPREIAAILKKSEKALGQGHLEESLLLALQAAEHYPENREARKGLGYAVAALGSPEVAIKILDKILKVRPKSPFLWFYAARDFFNLKRYPEAFRAYQKVCELIEENGPHYSTNAICKEARRQRYLSALSIEGTGADAAIKAVFAGKDSDLSVEEWNGIASSFLYRSKDPENALRYCDRVLRMEPENQESWYLRGAALLAQKRTKEALAAYEKAAKGGGYYAFQALRDSGAACYQTGDFTASLKYYDRLIALNPEGADAATGWLNRGKSLSAMKKNELAADSFASALALKSNNKEAWYGLACANALLKKFDAADSAVKKFLALSPKGRKRLESDPALRSYCEWAEKRSG